MSWVPVARVTGAHGVRGELRVRLYNPESSTLTPELAIVLRAVSAPDHVDRVRHLRKGPTAHLLALYQVSDRTRAEALKGAEVLVSEQDLPALEEGALYAFRLIGCRVIDERGQDRGIVAAVGDNGAHSLLRVHEQKTEWLLPFVDAFVEAVDVEGQRLLVRDVDSLTALATPRSSDREG